MVLGSSFALLLRITKNSLNFLFMTSETASLNLISTGKMRKIKKKVFKRSRGKTLESMQVTTLLRKN